MATELARGTYVRLLSAVYVSLFLIRVAFGVGLVTFPLYIGEESGTTFSLIVTASPLLELITIIFAGVLIDRYGRKGVLLTGLALGAVSLYGLALTRNVILLGLINALHGVAAAFILITTLAVLARHAPPDSRGREMGLFNFANIFGLVAGYVVGFLFADLFEAHIEYSFIVAGLLATAGLLFANRMIRLPGDRPTEGRIGRPAVRALLRDALNPQVVLLTAPWLIVFMLVGAFITFLSRATAAANIEGVSTAVGILLIGGLLVLGQLFWGRLADRYGREVIMVVGAVGLALLMGVVVYAYFETGSSDAEVVFRNVMSHSGLLIVLLFVSLAFAPAGLAAIADEARAGAEGTTMSAYGLTLSLGFILGPPVLGFVSDRSGSLGSVLYFAALAVLLLALVLTRFVQQRRRARSPAEESV